MTEIISPRMFASLAAFFPNVCTIQEASETRDAAGQPIPTWADKYQAVACRVQPAGANERRAAEGIYSTATHTVALAGYYPAITAKMRLVVFSDDLTLDILGAESDAGHNHTRVYCEVVT